jgi:PAS domain S-box-containing protein
MRYNRLQRIINKLVVYLPSTIFVAGLILTFLAAFFVSTSSKKAEINEFNLGMEQVETRIKDSAAFYNTLLYSARSLFYVNDIVSQPNFEKYTDNLYIEKEYPGIDAIGYILTFPTSQQNTVLNQLRNNGLTNFAIHPQNNDPTQNVILYAEPLNLRNQALIGLNLSGQEKHRSALDQARDLGVITSTGKISLEQPSEKESDPGFYTYLPIYSTEILPNSQQERVDQLRGYVFTIFNASDFLSNLFSQDESNQINFSIYDGDTLDESQLLFSNNPDRLYEPELKANKKIEILGHNWNVYFTNKPTADINSLRHSVPTIIITGLILTTFIFITTDTQIRARFAAEKIQQQLLAAQSEVKASEERLRLVIQDSKEYLIIMLNKNGRIMSWNLGAENLLGFTEAEVLNKDYALFFTNREKKAKIPKQELVTALQKGSINFERHFVRKNGEPFWVSGVINAVHDQNRQLKGFTLIARDVSARKNIEADLIQNQRLTQAILNSLNTFIAVLDRYGNIIAVNNAWNKEKGTNFIDNPFKFKIGDNYVLDFEKIIKPTNEIIRQAWRGIQKVLNKTLPDYSLELPLSHLNGNDEEWFLLQVNPLAHDNEGVVVSYINITDRKKLEKQKDEFLRIASHELKTPITSIKAYAQVLLKILHDRADQKTVKALTKMDQQINKVTKLINDLLDVSKVEAGLLKFNFEYFDLAALVRDAVETIQLTSETHRLIIKGIVSQTIYSDKERVNQVLINLLNNAVKYSPQAKKVLINCSTQGENAVVQITDSGPGISEQDQEHIFERFFRVQSPEFQGYSGLGLGLYISTEIIHRLGGRIGVESKLGQGSTFFFTLPTNPHNKV